MFSPENRQPSHEILNRTVSKQVFEHGKSGCILPDDLRIGQDHLYTYRHILPRHAQAKDEFATDVTVNIVKVSSKENGAYFFIPIKPVFRNGLDLYEGKPIDCVVGDGGIVLNENANEPYEIEHGYFLPSERLEDTNSQSSVEMARIVLKHSVPEPLKYFTFDD